jgi:hypothetical protein
VWHPGFKDVSKGKAMNRPLFMLHPSIHPSIHPCRLLSDLLRPLSRGARVCRTQVDSRIKVAVWGVDQGRRREKERERERERGGATGESKASCRHPQGSRSSCGASESTRRRERRGKGFGRCSVGVRGPDGVESQSLISSMLQMISPTPRCGFHPRATIHAGGLGVHGRAGSAGEGWEVAHDAQRPKDPSCLCPHLPSFPPSLSP